MDIQGNNLYKKSIEITKKILQLKEKKKLPEKKLEEIVNSILLPEENIQYEDILPYLATTFAEHYYEITNSNPLELKRF